MKTTNGMPMKPILNAPQMVHFKIKKKEKIKHAKTPLDKEVHVWPRGTPHRSAWYKANYQSKETQRTS